MNIIYLCKHSQIADGINLIYWSPTLLKISDMGAQSLKYPNTPNSLWIMYIQNNVDIDD